MQIYGIFGIFDQLKVKAGSSTAMFFGKRIQHYFQFGVTQLSPESTCSI